MRTRGFGSFLFTMAALLLGGFLSTGCSSVEEVKPETQGQRGETCRARNDCAGGLACINNTCVQNDFPVDETGGACVLVECTSDAECWEPSLSEEKCEAANQNCQEFGTDCGLYTANCLPNAECVDQRCLSFTPCLTTEECFGAECLDGRCDARCSGDVDCPDGTTCVEGACIEGCDSDSQCPYFHSCTDGTCVETGCTTDRECAAFTDNPLATCADGVCQIACVSDAECTSPGGYDFFGCVEGLCVYLGCQTDEECRISLGVSPDSSQRAICDPAATTSSPNEG